MFHMVSLVSLNNRLAVSFLAICPENATAQDFLIDIFFTLRSPWRMAAESERFHFIQEIKKDCDANKFIRKLWAREWSKKNEIFWQMTARLFTSNDLAFVMFLYKIHMIPASSRKYAWYRACKVTVLVKIFKHNCAESIDIYANDISLKAITPSQYNI